MYEFVSKIFLDSVLYDMDVTADSSTIITAGTGKSASNRSEAIVSALQFNRSLKMVSEIILDSIDAQAATCIKRIPGNNDFAVGCFKHLVLLRFSGSSFEILNIINNVHSSKTFFLNFRYFL